MYESNTLLELVVGKTINSTKSSTVTDHTHLDYGVVFIQDELTSYWLPLIYSGKEYVKLVEEVIPPTTGSIKPVKVIVTCDDGNQYEATNFVKV
jgi:hypothetical protein